MMRKIYFSRDLSPNSIREIADILKKGGIGIMPTDTIYGISTSVFQPKSIEKIYHLRKRNPAKPMIILINNISDLTLFKISLNSETRKILNSVWPDKISLILPISDPDLSYLDRGTNTLAFRIPKYPLIQKILRISGPLVSPSANFEDEPSSKNIKEAQRYFGNNVDFYLDDGEKTSPPSTVVKLEKNKLSIIRQGAAVIPDSLVV